MSVKNITGLIMLFALLWTPKQHLCTTQVQDPRCKGLKQKDINCYYGYFKELLKVCWSEKFCFTTEGISCKNMHRTPSEVETLWVCTEVLPIPPFYQHCSHRSTCCAATDTLLNRSKESSALLLYSGTRVKNLPHSKALSFWAFFCSVVPSAVDPEVRRRSPRVLLHVWLWCRI